MAEEIEFVNGLSVKAPHENAPSFVKANLSIKVDDLKEWLNTKSGWVNIDVKESKGGKWYAQVSTFKPKEPEKANAYVADKDEDLIPF
jgi:hypothetical protein